ncbi:MAG: hypothetical protein IPP46_06155 [Bacteroidetes bacterium]|nr:hypothetical protein [Bacteroidota bacterium]
MNTSLAKWPSFKKMVVYDSPQEEGFIESAYEPITNISIDFAIMERRRRMYM